jgi:hypothetical protein
MLESKEVKAAKVYGTTDVAVEEDGPAPRPCKLKCVSFTGSFSACMCVCSNYARNLCY